MSIKEPLSAVSTKKKLTGMLGQRLLDYFSRDSSLLLVVVYDAFIKGHDFEEAHTTDLHIDNLLDLVSHGHIATPTCLKFSNGKGTKV